MSTYIVGSDRINGKEQTYINQVITQLQEKNHTCFNAGVGPNRVQAYARSNPADIGIMIVGGRGMGTPIDFHTGCSRGYYKISHAYVIGSSEFTGNKLLSTASMDQPQQRCEPGMSSVQCKQYLGLTPKQFNEKFNHCTMIYCDNFQDGINQILGGGSSSGSAEPEKQGTSYKDMIKDLLSAWDGRAEAWISGNTLHVRRIPPTEEKPPLACKNLTQASKEKIMDHKIPREPEIWASEGVNIISGSLSMTDYNPNTTNKLIVTYTDSDGELHNLEFKDQILYERFGEKLSNKDAVYYAHDDTNQSVEMPVETREEAIRYGLGEWFKLQRENGHTVECKVIGSNHWHIGRWCKIYLPMFGEYTDMYVNKCNHTFDNNGWITNVELLPAPAMLASASSDEDAKEDEKKEKEEGETDEQNTESNSNQ
jgi:hypothetical protein